jgi:hypothetical protein|tara:strand:- start:839 stop:991 length:153 start_codon:yes stop_codon:yes gene_type:complete
MRYLLILLFVGFFNSCEDSKGYDWKKDVPFEDILSQAGGKIILMDFETDW